MKLRFAHMIPCAAVICALVAGIVFVGFPLYANSGGKGYMYIYSDETVWSPSERPKVVVRGSGATRVDLTVWKFDPSKQYKDHGSLHSAMRDLPQDATLVRRFSEYPRPKKAGGEFTMKVAVPTDGVGGYVIKARDSQGREESAWVLVTDLGLVTKQAQDRLIVYAHAFGQDAPCEGAKIAVYNEGKQVIAEGATGSDGIWTFDRPAISKGLSIVGTAGESFAQVSSSYYWEDLRYRVYIYTDRPIYRPGQRVSFKCILREEAGGDYRVMAGEEIRVEVQDSAGACICRLDGTTNKYGSFAGDTVLGDEPALGSYRVLATVRGSVHSGWFKVAEYRKPEYKVELETDRPNYVAGDEISVSLKAAYYFGAPVPGAKVRYSVFSQPHSISYYSPGDLGYYPVADEDYGYYGELVESGEGSTDQSGSMTFTVRTKKAATTKRLFIEAYVTDESRREVAGRTSAIVARGLFDVSVQPDAYVVSPGEQVQVRVKAETLDGKPIAADLVWQSMRISWEGRKSARWKEESGKIAAGADGRAAFKFTPAEEGSYVVEVAGVDERGNEIVSEAYVWAASGASGWASYGGQEIEIIADKDVYEVGDVAKLLVNTTFDDVWALVTVEGRELIRQEAVRIEGHTRLFEVPITGEHMPNAFFGITFVSGKRLYSQEKPIYVSEKSNFLNVSVIPDKEVYGPGERATYIVKVTDAAGRPVQAEISLGVVDASIYAIQSEIAPDIKKAFYGPVWNRVVMNYSFPRWYDGGADKGGGDSGVRKDFPDTAFWAPAVVTDRGGTAKIQFNMPDTLTTWRATVRAHTLKTQVGSVTRDVVATKDLVVRLATPRIFTLGDATSISAIVHNYTGRRVDAKVTLKAEGVTVQDPGQRTVALEPMGQASLDWKVACGDVGKASFVASAQAGRAKDAIEVGVPVLPFGERREWHRSGEIDRVGSGGPASLAFDIPSDALPGTVSAKVRLAPSVAATALGALEYLTSYPYGCVEQTMNSFLPNIVVARTLRDLGIKAPEIEGALPELVSAGLARLYRYQHGDGGWGWWRYDATDDRMTAYTVYGLDLARKAGFHVDEGVLARGRNRLANSAWAPRSVNDLVYKLYVMSEVGEKSLPRLDEMVARRRELSNYSLSLLALTLKNVGREGDAQLALEDLLAASRGDDARTYWEALTDEWDRADNRVETTAYALMAMLAVDPGNEKIPGAVRWLADSRRGNAWLSTKDTAVAVFALTEYMKLRDEASPDSTATVSLNGKQAAKVRFDRKSLFEREMEISMDASLLVPGRNELTIAKAGKGRLYYSVSCEYYAPQDPVAAKGQGLAVKRGYYRRTAAAQKGVAGVPKGEKESAQASYTYDPVTGAVRPGEEIFVRIAIKAGRPYSFMMIEDPLPSGFEVVDDPIDRYSWNFWYGRREVRDEKVAFFSSYLREGENEIIYSIRVERPGRYCVMPTRAWGMYSPDVFGQSESGEIACEEPVLASFATTIKDPELSRNHNIALAASAIDGTVLQSGEVFSFDRVVGPRLSSAGYRDARVISGGRSVPGIAGGICQVSTTLYNAALLAGLEVVERHPHSQPVDYVPPGLDATVSEEGGQDLKFRNQLMVPVRISAGVDGPRLLVELRGAVPEPPEVRLSTEVQKVERPRLIGTGGADAATSWGKSGLSVTVWRSIAAGGQARRELVSEDRYSPIHAMASASQ